MKIFFPGSFDPFTIGHEDLIVRAIKMFQNSVSVLNKLEIHICIMDNSSKESYFSLVHRVVSIEKWIPKFMENHIELLPVYEIKVSHSKNDLSYAYAKKIGADFILRGIRNVIDFEYEKQIADFNKEFGEIETLFLINDPKNTTSSSVVRELWKHREYKKAQSKLPKGFEL